VITKIYKLFIVKVRFSLDRVEELVLDTFIIFLNTFVDKHFIFGHEAAPYFKKLRIQK
jgi:hypothetical protein